MKNYASDAWFAADDGNIKVTKGHYMVFVKLTEDNRLAAPIVCETPAYYVVGTCGNGGWAADANAENEAYKMADNGDGTYSLKVNFTDKETAEWAGGKVAFKCVYGCGGNVANEHWFGAENGDNILVAPGEYTITLNPAEKTVTVK